MTTNKQWRSIGIWLGMLAGLAALMVIIGTAPAFAQSKGGTKPGGAKPTGEQIAHTLADQIVNSYPLTVTTEDNTQMSIFRKGEQQFYGEDAEGVYIWANVGGQTKVFGPEHVPAGNTVNPYTNVSNTKTGSGTPADPYKLTTVVRVPGTPLQLTQFATYVAGAEYTRLTFSLEQIGASQPMTVSLFHAADLYTAGSDSGFGFYDSTSGGVGSYYTRTNGSALYQQFVPNSDSARPNAYMESYYSTIWSRIGNTSGPGGGFDNTIISDTQHDAGAGLQWNLTIPASGKVTVGDSDLFSPLSQLCGSFSDVAEGDFYYYDIAYLACAKIVSGYSDGTFRPNATTTRGQLSKIIVLGQHWAIDTTGGPHFTDVPTTNPYYQFIETAYHHNVISGYADHTFRWGDNVTRGQIAKIIVVAKGWTINTSGGPHFTDVPATNTFYNYIETARAKGVISGYADNTFKVGNPATRGQLSKIVHLALTTSK